MKILVYGINYAPELTGIGKYSSEMCEWLAIQGHEVRVVTAPPYYPEWKVSKPYSPYHYSHEEIKGVHIWRAPLWVPKKISGVKRVLHLLSFSITSLPVVLGQVFWRPDVVLTVAPAFTCAPAGWLTARLSGAKAWLHIQDFEVDVAFKMGMLKGRLLQKAVLGLESFLLKRFDCVSTISHRMMELLQKKEVDVENTYQFLNWVNTRHIRSQTHVNAFREELNIASDTKVILFSGTLNSKQGLEIIPQLARKLEHRKDIMFVIGGEGVMKPELEAASEGLSNIKFLPLQPVERLSELLAMANMHLLPQNSDAEDLVLPSKLSGMLASGRPVVAICNNGSEIAKVVVECGLVVPPNDEAALMEAIFTLVENASERERLGIAARHYAEVHLSIEHILNNVVNEMSRMTQPAITVLNTGKL
ncbi:colanic acid biosynthesis glycosyl transferase WcaI [Oxalobacteraceae bacterium GrIS 2.11]